MAGTAGAMNGVCPVTPLELQVSGTFFWGREQNQQHRG